MTGASAVVFTREDACWTQENATIIWIFLCSRFMVTWWRKAENMGSKGPAQGPLPTIKCYYLCLACPTAICLLIWSNQVDSQMWLYSAIYNGHFCKLTLNRNSKTQVCKQRHQCLFFPSCGWWLGHSDLLLFDTGQRQNILSCFVFILQIVKKRTLSSLHQE